MHVKELRQIVDQGIKAYMAVGGVADAVEQAARDLGYDPDSNDIVSYLELVRKEVLQHKEEIRIECERPMPEGL
jgi:hypothetical protein